MKVKIWLPIIKGSSGIDIFTRRLADALQRHGIEAEVTWYPIYFQFAPFLLKTVPPPPRTDLIHALSWNGFAFKRPGIPLVVTEQLGVSDPIDRSYKSLAQHLYHETLIRRFARASFFAASAITAVSHFTAAGLARAFGIHSALVIYNWVNTRVFSPTKQIPLSTQPPFRLLFMGNPSRRKGADLLIPIMRELGNAFELRFTSGLRNLRMRGVQQNMVPLGRLTGESQLIKAYRQCDALLFPSRFEGLPQAPLEAMACSKPVIAARSSSLPEVVEDGATGALCPKDDLGAFVTACRKLADHPEILYAYGQAARRRAEQLFSEEIVIPQYIALYEKLVKETGF